MLREEIEKAWLDDKTLISFQKLCWVDRLESGPFQLDAGDPFLSQYVWYRCPDGLDHLASCARDESSWSPVLFCSVCNKRWLVINNVEERMQGEEQKFFYLLAKHSVMLSKYDRASLTGEVLCKLHQTYGLVPDIVGSICDVTLSAEILADYAQRWESHCLSGKG